MRCFPPSPRLRVCHLLDLISHHKSDKNQTKMVYGTKGWSKGSSFDDRFPRLFLIALFGSRYLHRKAWEAESLPALRKVFKLGFSCIAGERDDNSTTLNLVLQKLKARYENTRTRFLTLLRRFEHLQGTCNRPSSVERVLQVRTQSPVHHSLPGSH